MLYVALGDSITAGESASSWARAYPSLVTSILTHSRHGMTRGEVLAEPGWTSRDLELEVYNQPLLYLRNANVVSIWVGGDDLIHAGMALLQGAPKTIVDRTVIRYGKDIATLVAGIRKISRARIILCTQYNPFPNTPIAGQGISALNAATNEVAGRMNVAVAPVDAWFEGRQAALIYGYRTGRIQDALRGPVPPVHPNNRGHRVIAENLAGMMGGA